MPLLLRRACPLLLLTLVAACGTSTNSGSDPGSEPDRAGTDAPVEQHTQPPQDPIPLPDLQNGLGDHRSDPTGGGLGKR